MSLPFELRRASADDFEMLYELTRRSMGQYVAQTWGSWDDELQRKRFEDGPRPEEHQIITSSSRVIGCICILDSEDALWLERLFIDPDFQNQGVGTAILRDLISKAKERGARIRLHVLKVNPARGLYERLGFRVVLERGHDYEMECAA